MKTNIVFIGNSSRSCLTTLQTVIDRELVIPNYQRPYAWSEDHIEDLFNTIKSSFEDNQEQSTLSGKYPAFFGSVIVSYTQDNKYLIIDGQQRITTFLLVLRVILDKLNEHKKQIEDRLYKLDGILEKEQEKGDIKKAKDTLSSRMQLERKQNKLNDLIKKIENILKKTNISRDSSFLKNTEEKTENEYIKYITGKDFKGSKDFKKNKEKVANHINGMIDALPFDSSDEYQKYSDIVDYILNMSKFCLLCISGRQSEEYAIDVFNTLNTTGEPLTGFEVFKSTIIKIGREFGKEKPIEKDLYEIENSIKKLKPNRKYIITQTGKLMLYLAIYRNDYQDKKLSDKKFKEQNTYIKHALNEKTALSMLADIHGLNDFVIQNWLPKNPENRNYCNTLSSKKAILAKKSFDFLIDINHDRVIPVIYKWSKSCLGTQFNAKEYQKIIELCVTFSCLWRMAFDGGAQGIDAEYLAIAKELKNKNNIDKAHSVIHNRFKEKFNNKNTWLNNMKISNINKNKKITKFLLALISLRDISSYRSNEWVSFPVSKDINTLNRLGNIILIPKSEEKKFADDRYKNLQHLLKDNFFNKDIYDIADDFSHSEIDKRAEKLSELIWQNLYDDFLNPK